MTEKKFEVKFIVEGIFRADHFIGLAKAMIKTNAKVIGVSELPYPKYIIFSVKEKFPIFKRQLESYGFLVEELNKRGTLNNHKR